MKTLPEIKKPVYRPVTLIVGIICKEGIVLASDSQTSYSLGTSKRTDRDKMTVMKFGNRNVLIGQAGDVILSSRTVEFLEGLFQSSNFDDWRKPADLAQQAVENTKQGLFKLNSWDESGSWGREYLDNNPFTLMVAYYYTNKNGEEEPFLYVLNSVPGYATRELRFAAVGCGATVGQFILERANVSELEFSKALIAAIYCVEEVKRVDSFCGGKTRAAAIGPTKVVCSENDESKVIKRAVETIEKLDGFIQKKWSDIFSDIIGKINDGENRAD